jgi:hypothetical protein
MKSIDPKAVLQQRIAVLKVRQIDDLINLKQQYTATVDSFKPLNLIKSASLEFISNPDLKSNLIKVALGFGGDYLSKNLLNENSTNPIKRVLGKFLKIALKKFVGKNRTKSSDID